MSNAPRKGDIITYRGEPVGTVTHTEGNLCWRSYRDGESLPFIWRFADGTLNTLHSWPGKAHPLDRIAAEQAAYYGTTPDRLARGIDDLVQAEETEGE